MSIAESLSAVRDAAQILTREGKVLTLPNPEFPLAVFAETYNVDEEAKPVEMTDELAASVEDHFEEVNEEEIATEGDSREALIENTHLGLSKTLFTTNNVIIPAIKDMHSYFAGLQTRSGQPEYRVEPFIYADIHNSPVLVNHVNTRYTRVRPLQEYKSFRLDPIGADQIIEAVAVNNPHLEQEEVTEWALQMGSEKVEAVWNSLFATSVVSMNSLPYLQMTAAPFNVDELALAYFLCGHYMEEAQNVEGVGLDEWTVTMQLMHEAFGFYLGQAYALRAEQRETGVLILKNEASDPITTRRAVVIVNNDVSAPWLIAGGDIQAVLGAAIDNPGLVHLEAIEKNRDGFIKRWLAIYPLIKQAAIDYADRSIRDDVVATFLHMSRTCALKDMTAEEVDIRMQAAMRQLSREDLRNPYKTFSTLIVEVYFPNTNYKLFLEAIDEYGQDFPGATLRELNTQAIITLTAIFLAKQIKVESYVPDIDPNAVVEETEDTSDFDSGVLAVAMDESEAPEGSEFEVEGVEVEESVGGEATIDEVEETEFTGEAEVTEEVADSGDDSLDTDMDDEPDPYADLEEEENGGIEAGAEEAEESDEEQSEATTAEEEDESPLA